MKKYRIWTLRHPFLAAVLFCLFCCPVYTGLLLWLQLPAWLVVLVNLLLILISAAIPTGNLQQLTKGPSCRTIATRPPCFI